VVIPIYDNDPLEKSHRAYVTFVLIALNIAIYVVQDAASDATSTSLLLNFALFRRNTGDAWLQQARAITACRADCRCTSETMR